MSVQFRRVPVVVKAVRWKGDNFDELQWLADDARQRDGSPRLEWSGDPEEEVVLWDRHGREVFFAYGDGSEWLVRYPNGDLEMIRDDDLFTEFDVYYGDDGSAPHLVDRRVTATTGFLPPPKVLYMAEERKAELRELLARRGHSKRTVDEVLEGLDQVGTALLDETSWWSRGRRALPLLLGLVRVLRD